MPETSFVKTTLTTQRLRGQGIETALEEILLSPKINTEFSAQHTVSPLHP